MSKDMYTTVGLGIRLEEWPRQLVEYFEMDGFTTNAQMYNFFYDEFNAFLVYENSHYENDPFVASVLYAPSTMSESENVSDLNPELMVGIEEIHAEQEDSKRLPDFLRKHGVLKPLWRWLAVAEHYT